ncbi:MAG: HD domain-containing protein [Deltaproteobacteria bacterium]|nr:HD domain-containing protein [Deltaproteobacteria bacterium]
MNPDFLWQQVRDSIPTASEVVVLSPDGETLFQSQPAPPGLVDHIMRERGRGIAGDSEWSGTTEALLVVHASVFLKPAFLSEGWTVAVIKPRSEAFAAADQFIRVLFLTIALLFLATGLVALVLIRRNTAPLAVLEEGTRRISGGDFDSRIRIDSGDEFEDFARSFNAMADHLGKEFRAQAGLGRTIQSILGETDQGGIVRTLLDNVDSVIPCVCAGLSLLETPGKEGAAITCTREGSSSDPSGIGRAMMFLDPHEMDRLKCAATTIVAKPDGEFGGFLSRWPGLRPAAFLLSPLVSHGELKGVLLLGRMDPGDPAPEILIRLRQIADQTSIALSRARLVEELNENDLGTLQALSRAVDTNSHWTAGHSQRVTSLAMEIGWELGLPPREIDSLQRGGLLHDIGKLGIPTSILDKPAALTEEEFALIKGHPSSGAEILRPIPTMGKIIPIVAQHHERFDGTGYPLGLSGNDISLHARILAVADVVDALSSNRPYRSGWPREKVLAFILGNSGVQFDPDVVKAFLRIASLRKTGSLTGTPWIPAPERPENPLPLDPVSPGIPPLPARGASFSGYSEPSLRG